MCVCEAVCHPLTILLTTRDYVGGGVYCHWVPLQGCAAPNPPTFYTRPVPFEAKLFLNPQQPGPFKRSKTWGITIAGRRDQRWWPWPLPRESASHRARSLHMFLPERSWGPTSCIFVLHWFRSKKASDWQTPHIQQIEWVISKFNGTSTPTGSYSAKTGVNCTMSLSRVY